MVLRVKRMYESSAWHTPPPWMASFVALQSNKEMSACPARQPSLKIGGNCTVRYAHHYSTYSYRYCTHFVPHHSFVSLMGVSKMRTNRNLPIRRVLLTMLILLLVSSDSQPEGYRSDSQVRAIQNKNSSTWEKIKGSLCETL